MSEIFKTLSLGTTEHKTKMNNVDNKHKTRQKDY